MNLNKMSQKSMARVLALTLALWTTLAFTTGLIAAPADLSEKVAMEYLRHQVGPVRDRNKSPALYKSLETILERLDQAEREMNPELEKFVISNRILILDSLDIPMAAVMTLQKNAIASQRNIVVFSTGMIVKLLQGRNGSLSELSEVFTAALAGIMAHERSHPIYYADYSSRHAKETSQSEEILADSRGVTMAEKAGYPKQSLYDALEHLNSIDDESIAAKNKEKNATQRAMEEGLSTHPQNVLRATHFRILLTIKRLLEGTKKAQYPEPQTPGFLRDIAKILEEGQLKLGAQEFQPAPKDFLEVYERVNKGLDSQNNTNRSELRGELNALLSWMNEWILRGQINAQTEFERISDLLIGFTKSGLGFLDPSIAFSYNYDDQRAEMKFKSFERPSHPFHEDYVLDSVFYRSPDWQRRVRSEFPSFSESYLQIQQLLRPEEIFDVYKDEVIAFFKNGLANESEDFWKFSGWYVSLNLRQKLHWAQGIHEWVVPNLNETELVHLMLLKEKNSSKARANVNLDPIMLLLSIEKMQKTEDAEKNSRKNLEAHFKKYPQDEKNFNELCKLLWARRDFYVQMDFLTTEGRVFFWDLIIETLHLEKTSAYLELNKSFENRLQAKALFPLAYSLRTKDLKNSKTRLSWMAKQDISQFNYQTSRGTWVNTQGQKRYYHAVPEAFSAEFKKHLTEAFKNQTGDLDKKALDEIVETTYWSLTGTSLDSHEGNKTSSTSPAPLEGEVAEAIWESGLSIQAKKELLEDRYMRTRELRGGERSRYDYNGLWILQTAQDANLKVFQVLLKARIVSGVRELFKIFQPGRIYAQAHPYTQKGYMTLPSDFSQAAVAMGTIIQKDLQKVDLIRSPELKARELLDVARTYLEDAKKYRGSQKIFDKDLFREIRSEIVRQALPLDIPLIKRVRIFEAITHSGAVAATDQYFKQAILPQMSEINAISYDLLKRSLEQKRFVSQSLTIDLAQKLLRAKAMRLAGNSINADQMLTYLEEVNSLVPADSFARDEMIEALSWDLGLQEDRMLNLMESHKSVNWRKLNPQLVNWASFFSEHLADLNPEQTRLLIDYLTDPHHKDLPSVVELALEKAARNTVETALEKSRDQVTTPEDKERIVKDATSLLKQNFITMAKDSSALDRVPIFDLLLHSGLEPIAKADDFPENVVRDILKYKMGSPEEIALRSWLEIIPPDERYEVSVTLSYQISTMGAEKSSIRSGFEFFGAIGKKTGQVASLFGVFSDDINIELAKLKDRSKAMSKVEIKEMIRTRLGHDQFELVEVLGSASVKTVVAIRLPNGEIKAVMLRQPGAKETLSMHVERAKAYVKQLAKNGLTTDIELFNAYIESLEQSLPQELDFRNEAKVYDELEKTFKKITKDLKGVLPEGWEFTVPKVDRRFAVTDDFYVTDYVEGMSFDKLENGDLKESIGRSIFKGNALGLLRYGAFDPDRHMGNHLIDVENKRIGIIDPGQFMKFSTTWNPFKADDRSYIAKFLYGISKGDVDSLMSSIEAMKAKGVLASQVQALRSDLAKIVASNASTFVRSKEIVKLLHQRQVRLDFRFSFTAIKGLMILLNEPYASAKTTENDLKGLVVEALAKKVQVRELRKIWKDEQPLRKIKEGAVEKWRKLKVPKAVDAKGR